MATQQPRLTGAAAKTDTTVAKNAKKNVDDDSSSSSSEEEIIACCLCHCCVDYADREVFFPREGSSSSSSASRSTSISARNNKSDKNRKESRNNEDDDDLLLPTELYDEFNNIVFCDGCDRSYHQKCHFVPLLSIPRGDWYCLICSYRQAAKKKKIHNAMTKKQLDSIYPSPPREAIVTDEHESLVQRFELETASLKASLWRRELSLKFGNVLQQQLGQIRHTQFTLRAYTSTHRARQFLSKRSQELSQTLVKLYYAQARIRTHLYSLQSILMGRPQEELHQVLLDWIQQQQQQQQQPRNQVESLTEKWFPFGTHHKQRTIPRFQQADNDETHLPDGIPTQVVVTETETNEKSSPKNAVASNTASASATTDSNNDDDDDDMISLDDLRCCVCFKGDATDENDLLLCDGVGCYRAYHAKCVLPHVQVEQDEEEDWFCPICSSMAKHMYHVQAEYMGHEWEERPERDTDQDSVKSWDHVSDVFEGAERKLEIATRWKNGEHDEETDALVSSVLGIDYHQSDTSEGQESSLEDEDDDDFDMEVFHQKKQAEDDADDNSSVSTNATLKDMSSVEYEIDRNELDALSGGSDEDESDAGTSRRLRRRRATTRSSGSQSGNDGDNDDDSSSEESSKPNVDIGTLDESNIIQGKRNRPRVDYQRLNDSMFGWIEDDKAVKLFDDREDEFQVKQTSSSRATSRATSDVDDSSDDNDESSEDEENSNSCTSSSNNDKKGRHKAGKPASKSRKGRRKKAVSDSESSSSSAKQPVRKRPRTENPGRRKKSSRKRRRPQKFALDSSEDDGNAKPRLARQRKPPKRYDDSSSSSDNDDKARKNPALKQRSRQRKRPQTYASLKKNVDTKKKRAKNGLNHNMVAKSGAGKKRKRP